MSAIEEGDLVAAFDVSGYLAHVRNGAVLDYHAFPTYADLDDAASGVTGGLFSVNSNAVIYQANNFYFAGFYFQDGTGDLIRVVVRMDLAGNTFKMYTQNFGAIEPNNLMTSRPDVAGEFYWAVNDNPGFSDIDVKRFSHTFVLLQNISITGNEGDIEQAGVLSHVNGCDLRYHYATISPAASGIASANICNNPTPGTSLFSESNRAIRALMCIPAFRSPSTAQELLLGLFSGSGTWVHRRDWDDSTLIQSYTGDGLPRVESLCQDFDDDFFWAGHFPVFGNAPENLYKFDVNAGTYSSSEIDRQEGGSTFPREVRGLSTIVPPDPNPPPVTATPFVQVIS